MTVNSDICIVLGAVLGVISVYLAPYRVRGAPAHDKVKNNKFFNLIENNSSKLNGSSIIIQGSDKLLNNESTPKIYGDTTFNNVLDIMRQEISKLINAEKWTIIVPKEKASEASPNFCEARSQFTVGSNEVLLNSTEFLHNENDGTEYKDIPDVYLLTSDEKKKNIKNERNFYSFGISNDDKSFINAPRQSTLLNSKSPRSPNYKIDDETLDGLEAFANDSGYSVITVQNDNVAFRLKKSKSPINRLFQEIKCLLGFKKQMRQKKHIPNNISIITSRNNDVNLTV